MPRALNNRVDVRKKMGQKTDRCLTFIALTIVDRPAWKTGHWTVKQTKFAHPKIALTVEHILATLSHLNLSIARFKCVT